MAIAALNVKLVLEIAVQAASVIPESFWLVPAELALDNYR